MAGKRNNIEDRDCRLNPIVDLMCLDLLTGLARLKTLVCVTYEIHNNTPNYLLQAPFSVYFVWAMS